MTAKSSPDVAWAIDGPSGSLSLSASDLVEDETILSPKPYPVNGRVEFTLVGEAASKFEKTAVGQTAILNYPPDLRDYEGRLVSKEQMPDGTTRFVWEPAQSPDGLGGRRSRASARLVGDATEVLAGDEMGTVTIHTVRLH